MSQSWNSVSLVWRPVPRNCLPNNTSGPGRRVNVGRGLTTKHYKECYMAKTNVSAGRKDLANPEEIARMVYSLGHCIATVYSTGVCVALALIHQDADSDRYVATCIQRNIVTTLGQLATEIGAILTALGEKPFEKLSPQSELGWFLAGVRPLDTAARKSSPRLKR
jgi:hypothetical protein